MIPFNPKNWYYVASDARVYSTAAMAEVSPDNPSYVAWRASGLTPSTWPGSETETDIRAALTGFDYPCAPITRRQFYQQCAAAGLITESEALAVVATGVLPAALATIISALPSDQQFAAKMVLLGGGDFHRNHPLAISIGTAQGMTPAQMDAFFQAAAQL